MRFAHTLLLCLLPCLGLPLLATQSAPVDSHAYIPDGQSAAPGTTITVPVWMHVAQPLSQTELTIDFDSSRLEFLSVDAADTLSEPWGVIIDEDQDGQLRLTGSDDEQIDHAGLWINLRFTVTSAAPPGQCTDLTVSTLEIDRTATQQSPVVTPFCIESPYQDPAGAPAPSPAS